METLKPMTTDWTIEEGEAGRGRVSHSAAPRFTAFWTSGEDGQPDAGEPCWTSPGSGPEDAIHIFGWTWLEPAPAPEAVDALMKQATTAIDSWIASRF